MIQPLIVALSVFGEFEGTKIKGIIGVIGPKECLMTLLFLR